MNQILKFTYLIIPAKYSKFETEMCVIDTKVLGTAKRSVVKEAINSRVRKLRIQILGLENARYKLCIFGKLEFV